MPFDSESARKAGRKGKGGNRWIGKDPATNRTAAILFRFAESEIAMINDKAEKLRMTRPTLVVEAVKAYKGKKSAGK